MQFRLENPEHQKKAIRSVVEIFRGMERNTYDNATVEDIRANYCSLSSSELSANIQRVAEENNIPLANACLQDTNDACIEMETKKLKQSGRIIRIGGSRNGGEWKVVE